MNLRALQCFVVLAEELNFSRAAERLHIAQPALSQQIRSLEDRLGTQLVDRARRPLMLTEARQILGSLEQMSLAAQEIGVGRRGWLSIGFTRSSMSRVLIQTPERQPSMVLGPPPELVVRASTGPHRRR